MNFKQTHKRSRSFVAAGIILLLTITGCDQSFDPFKENDLYYYSLFGYLDVSENTQWIRVINLQEDIDPSGTGMDGVVTLENLETGESITLNDSLFQYSASFYAYNFWTTYEIEPEQNYRINAVRSDGAGSSVIVNMPSTFRDPTYEDPLFPEDPGLLRIWEVENLAEVSVRFTIMYTQAEITQSVILPLLSNVIPQGNDSYVVPINLAIINNAVSDLEDIEVVDCRIYVAKGGSDWIDFASLNPEILALPEAISNVESGTGYVVGVMSKTILFPNNSCSDQD